MNDLVVSILIPTYNRGRYLRCLLTHLVENISALRHAYEIVISDNASTDETESVVHEFIGLLNIRYIKRDKNYGGLANWRYLKWQAKGIFQVYLADDDQLIFPELSQVIDRMLANPDIGIVYSNFYHHDKVSGQYELICTLQEDVLINKGGHMQLLDLMLERQMLPEISVARSQLVRVVSPSESAYAYWAYVHAAEYLSHADVLFTAKPFYVAIHRYFNDESAERERLGRTEVQAAWDRYRGGLEFILSRTQIDKIDMSVFSALLVRINRFVSVMLSTGVANRMHIGSDPVETYYLASRLKAMRFFLMNFDEVRYEAIVHHVLNDQMLVQNCDKIMCSGVMDPGFLSLLLAKSHLPVYADKTFRPEAYENALVLVEGSLLDLSVDDALIESKALRLVGVADLFQKFC